MMNLSGNNSGASLRNAAMLFALLLSLFSCSSIDCPVQTTVAVKYQICQYQGGEAVADTLADTLSVWIQRSNGKDSLIMNRGVGLTTFSLPVSYQHPEDMLVMLVARKTGVWSVDTVWLQKDDIPHFESVDCPAHFFHQLTAVRSTHNAIDTIAINNPSVSFDSDITNINVSFK